MKKSLAFILVFIILSIFGVNSQQIIAERDDVISNSEELNFVLIGTGWLDGNWENTQCYKLTNKLVKRYAKENAIVYHIVPYYRKPMLSVLWYFDHNKELGNQLNIILVDNDGIKQEYCYKYPYDLQWLWNVECRGWSDSLLIVRSNGKLHPNDFQNVPEMGVFADDKAIVYDSTYIKIDMPTYYLLERYGARLDSLSPIYKTYHESYEHFVYPIVDSLMAGKSEEDINIWKGY